MTLIARGELPGFDLGQALPRWLGGGGHATAASARLKETTLLEARERLLELPAPAPCRRRRGPAT